ncbi:MAG: ATP-binding cassette domain-containing protein [Patescibacteria group bacterium]|jgi:ABC-2 type transport system ATP-binding protein
MSSNNAILIKDLRHSFKKLEVLKGLNLTVEKGTILALLGPNGAGKTTTIRILSTLLRPDAGEVMVNGYNVVAHGQKVRESIGLTGQYAAVDEFLTGVENLEMMGRLYHLSSADAKRRAKELLQQFDLVEAGDRAVKTYSGGMRRRLDLAASLIATPPIIFLDEPTTGLDPRSRLAMWDIIEKLVEADVTILLTTQHLEEADRLADRIAVLDNGIIITEGTADELKSQVGNERLEIVIKDAGAYATALNLLNAQGVLSDEKNRSISLPTDGNVSEVRRVLDVVEKAGIAIETLSLHKPTLDDVFLHFTGHKAEEEKPEDGDTAGKKGKKK